MPLWTQYILGTVVLLLQSSPEPIVVQQAANWTSVIMALVVGLPATISAIVGGMALLQVRRNAEVAARTGAAVTSNIQKTDTVIEKATEIHTLTNSNLSKVQGQLDVATAKIEEFNKAQAEAARKIANMEQLITQLIPAKGEQTPSQSNSDKLDGLKTMLNEVQQGTPPIPVHDEAVLKKLTVIADKTDKKLDTLQGSADDAAQQTAKDKAQED